MCNVHFTRTIMNSKDLGKIIFFTTPSNIHHIDKMSSSNVSTYESHCILMQINLKSDNYLSQLFNILT